MHLANEVGFNKLGHLIAHGSRSFWSKLSSLLPYRMAAQRDVELMGDDFGGDPRYVSGRPCKGIHISSKSFGQFVGIFRVQPGTDLHLFLQILVVKGY